MKFIKRVVELREDDYKDRIGLFSFFDIHLGSNSCDETLLKEDIEGVCDRGDFWIDGGDKLESINRKDKRYKEENTAKWCWGEQDIVRAQIDKYKEYFAPIRNKSCLCSISGNHEDAQLRMNERDVHYEVVSWLKDGILDSRININGGIAAIIEVIFRYAYDSNDKYHQTATFHIFVGHGYGGGRLEGAGPLALGRLLKENDVDLAFMGHRHHGAYVHQVQRQVRGSRIVDRNRFAFLVPPYRRNISTTANMLDKVAIDYSEIKLFPPNSYGGVRVVFNLQDRTIENPLRNFA